MRAALKKACVTLGLKCDVDDPMTAVIVDKIVAHPKVGTLAVQRGHGSLLGAAAKSNAGKVPCRILGDPLLGV
jgi:hypothetical protein